MGERAAAWGIPAAVGLGSFLLFGVQPIVGKAILPWFGGTAAVWTTCLLVFQVGLLIGYVYSHLLATRVPLRWQGAIHAAAIAAACFVPILPGESWKPAGGEALAPRIVPMLAASVGARYFVLAASGTLLQHWYSRLRPGRSPYPLYALSNAGSMAALVSYPFAVEPLLPLGGQARYWTAGFAAFAALSWAAAWGVWRRGEGARPEPRREVGAGESARGSRIADAVFWVGWSATGVVLFMAATQHLTMNVASVPLLWILPLAVYLTTYIVAFLPGRTYSRPVFAALLLPAIAVVRPVPRLELAYRTEAGLLLAALFVFLMVCHGELYRRRPAASRLTAYYFCIALGGASGGAVVALVAPRIFLFGEELSVGVLLLLGLLAATVWPSRGTPDRHRRWIQALVPVCALLAAVLLVHHVSSMRRNLIWAARNDYGLLRVQRFEAKPGEPAHLRLHNGTILHGAQFLEPERRHLPTWYYTVAGGGGAVLQYYHPSSPRDVGVLGLGAGTLAAYGREGDRFRFYEIDPNVVKAAREQFAFLSGSRAKCEIALGDARLVLEREPPRNFDVLILDAFSSDAVPVHLLTVEAFELYLRHLRPAGVIAAHISNLHVDLSPLLFRLGERYGLRSLLVATEEERAEYLLARSNWVILTRDGEFLAEMQERFRPWRDRNVVGLYVGDRSRYRTVDLWTDDYSNLLQIWK